MREYFVNADFDLSLRPNRKAETVDGRGQQASEMPFHLLFFGTDGDSVLVDAATLKLYERVRSSKSPAVMMVTTVNCPGCHTALAPQTRNEIRRGEALIPCLRCGRLLYPETLAEAETG